MLFKSHKTVQFYVLYDGTVLCGLQIYFGYFANLHISILNLLNLHIYTLLYNIYSVVVSFDIVNMFPSIDNIRSCILNSKKQRNRFSTCWMYVWNATTLYLIRDFIYRKMALLWDYICHALIVILLCIGLIIIVITYVTLVIHLRSCIGKGLEMISLQYGTTLYKNFISSLKLWIALMHLVRSNLLCL